MLIYTNFTLLPFFKGELKLKDWLHQAHSLVYGNFYLSDIKAIAFLAHQDKVWTKGLCLLSQKNILTTSNCICGAG